MDANELVSGYVMKGDVMDYNRIRSIERSLKVTNRNWAVLGHDMDHVFKSIHSLEGFSKDMLKWAKSINKDVKSLWNAILCLGVIDLAMLGTSYIQDKQIKKLEEEVQVLKTRLDLQKIMFNLVIKEQNERTEDEESLRLSKPETDDDGHEAG